eukprot:COSAG02_NODE_155_length_33066_cov_32.167562_3_plen_112_part_00
MGCGEGCGFGWWLVCGGAGLLGLLLLGLENGSPWQGRGRQSLPKAAARWLEVHRAETSGWLGGCGGRFPGSGSVIRVLDRRGRPEQRLRASSQQHGGYTAAVYHSPGVDVE